MPITLPFFIASKTDAINNVVPPHATPTSTTISGLTWYITLEI